MKKAIFTISGAFFIHGVKIDFASVMLKYPEQDPDSVVVIGANFMRKRLRKFVNIEDEAYAGEKILFKLQEENHALFVMHAGAHYFERVEAEREIKEATKDYYASRGIQTA
jgi:hypothetical protein